MLQIGKYSEKKNQLHITIEGRVNQKYFKQICLQNVKKEEN